MSGLPFQTSSQVALLTLPDKTALCNAFVGKPISSVRSPAAIIDRSRYTQNCQEMISRASQAGARFRCHVKTHKTIEGVELQVGSDGAVVCSTMVECAKIIGSDLCKPNGKVRDVLYGVPIALDKIQDAYDLAILVKHTSNNQATLSLMIDSVEQVRALNTFLSHQPIVPGSSIPSLDQWSVFIKLDGGYHRAGIDPKSKTLREVISNCLALDKIHIKGFYAHFGHSYASRSAAEAQTYLHGEIECVNAAAGIAIEMAGPRGPMNPYILSVGSTPTAHVSDERGGDGQRLVLNGELEIHAGNYCCLDLQQVATSLVSLPDVSTSVLSRVVSWYPDRNEALVDAGGIAMSKDTGPIPGFGQVVEVGREELTFGPPQHTGWTLGRVSQEHGILTATPGDAEEATKLVPGDLVRVIGQHACMILANHPWIYIVDSASGKGGSTIVDVWVPWKGW